MARITKPELIDRISKKTKISKYDTNKMLNAFIEEMENYLANDSIILLKGFGQFETQMSKPKKGRNIHDGSVIDIPAKKRIKFTPGKELLNKIATK